MVNFIEDFLYQNAPENMPKGSYGQYPISEGFKSELGLSKKFPYEGFSTKYQGPDKTGLIDYYKKGFQSIFGNVPNTGIGGGTIGQRIIYENILRQLANQGNLQIHLQKLLLLVLLLMFYLALKVQKAILIFLIIFFIPRNKIYNENKNK